MADPSLDNDEANCMLLGIQLAEERAEAIKKDPTLRPELNFAGLHLSIVPSNTFSISRLRTLNLRNNKLETIPGNLGFLKQLQILNISDNNIRALPDTIGQLTRLVKLHAQNNKLSTLPPTIGDAFSLSEVLIQNNCISTLPSQIGELFNLQHLDAGNNKLSVLPEELNTKAMPNLQVLNLQDNEHLEPLPWGLQSLQEIFPLAHSNDLRKSNVKRALEIRRRVQERLNGANAQNEEEVKEDM